MMSEYNVRCIGCIHHISYKLCGEWIHECNLKNMSKINCDDFEMKDELSSELDAHKLMYQVLWE